MPRKTRLETRLDAVADKLLDIALDDDGDVKAATRLAIFTKVAVYYGLKQRNAKDTGGNAFEKYKADQQARARTASVAGHAGEADFDDGDDELPDDLDDDASDEDDLAASCNGRLLSSSGY